MYNIIDSEYISITLDTVLILKNSKTTKNRYKNGWFYKLNRYWWYKKETNMLW